MTPSYSCRDASGCQDAGLLLVPETWQRGKPESTATLSTRRHCKGARPSILEVGCALGLFLEAYLARHERDCSYHGYDVLPEYVAECERAFPLGKFEVRNLFLEGIEGTYDTVVISQLFNNRYQKSTI